MPRTKAVVFDQDGTLIDTYIPGPYAYSVAVGRPVTLQELDRVLHLGAARNLVSALLGREATDADDDRFHAALAEATAKIEPYAGIVDLLTALRHRSIPTGVATNSDSRSAEVMLGTHGLDAFMTTICTVDRVQGVPKPAPDVILLAVRELGLEPSEVLFVGDSVADMTAGRAAGTVAVAAGWGNQAGKITAYDHWAHSPLEVLDLLHL
jgi:HAD superfamily hydrolase (TIGR01509 family)